MAHAGYFPTTELTTLRKFGSRLQGHPHREYLPFVETSSGPLGSGLSQAVGMALADRMNHGKKSHKYFYCLMGDGELNEGNIWEAVMLAGKEKLGTLIGIIDRNRIQIDGDTEVIMPLDPLGDKWKSFNWHVLEVDGHNFIALNDAINQAKAMHDKPTVIIANTVPSKGVKAWEYDYKWHGKPPKKEEGEMAIKELEALEA
jgi:transketolase